MAPLNSSNIHILLLLSAKLLKINIITKRNHIFGTTFNIFYHIFGTTFRLLYHIFSMTFNAFLPVVQHSLHAAGKELLALGLGEMEGEEAD